MLDLSSGGGGGAAFRQYTRRDAGVPVSADNFRGGVQYTGNAREKQSVSGLIANNHIDGKGTYIEAQERVKSAATAGTLKREPLYHLISTRGFFQPCPRCSSRHNGRDVLVTYFNLDTGDELCSFCAAGHDSRRLLQVRRSTYYEVAKVGEMERLTDIEGVQQYIINSSKVIFLRPRPQPRQAKGLALPARCMMDGRQLMDNESIYCSLRCKVEAEDPHFATVAPSRNIEKYVSRRKSAKARELGGAEARHPKATTTITRQPHSNKKLKQNSATVPETVKIAATEVAPDGVPNWGLRVKRYRGMPIINNTSSSPAKSDSVADARSHVHTATSELAGLESKLLQAVQDVMRENLSPNSSKENTVTHTHTHSKDNTAIHSHCTQGSKSSLLSGSLCTGDSTRSSTSKKRKGNPFRSPTE